MSSVCKPGTSLTAQQQLNILIVQAGIHTF